MFTGIIEEIGVVKRVEAGAKSTRLTIRARKVLEDLKHGDSVATDGVCLTVSHLQGDLFTADVMAQTLEHSTLGDLNIGSSVNLERALQLSTRLGGHIVSGHIDCTGTIVGVEKDDIAQWIKISLSDKEQMRYLIKKGSVSIDGISLTVARLDATTFSVSTIPVTQKDTTLTSKKVGEKVNIEFDILAKYTERLLNRKRIEEKKTDINEDFLRKYGFA